MRHSFCTPLVLLVLAPTLAACSGSSDLADRARDAIEVMTEPGDDGAADGPHDAVLVVANNTEGDVCEVHVSDHSDPDQEPYDLLETPLAPGESREFPYGSHAATDDHNLVASAVGCDGTEYLDYHFSYHLGAGRYNVHPSLED